MDTSETCQPGPSECCVGLHLIRRLDGQWSLVTIQHWAGPDGIWLIVATSTIFARRGHTLGAGLPSVVKIGVHRSNFREPRLSRGQ